MRILVVEDEKHLNRIISEAMEDEGYSVDSCFNGQEALEYMECAKYDVMILDIMMPRLNGLDLVRHLRRSGDATPVLFLTARDSVDDRVEGLESGGDYYLVQVVKEEKYGYMAKKFVQVDTSTPEPITTSVPTGAIGGTVRSSVVALRSSPDLSDSSNKVGQVEQNEPVYIYFKYTNAAGDTFYYIEVARTGKKAYAFSEYITAESSVPTGTPVP